MNEPKYQVGDILIDNGAGRRKYEVMKITYYGYCIREVGSMKPTEYSQKLVHDCTTLDVNSRIDRLLDKYK